MQAGTELRRGCLWLSGFPFPLRAAGGWTEPSSAARLHDIRLPATELMKTMNQHASRETLQTGSNT